MTTRVDNAVDPGAAPGSMWAGLFEPNALYVPFTDELADADLDLCAQLYDGALQRVRRARAPLERQLGLRLARLKRGDGLMRVAGARNLADYVKEHLRMSVRSAQAMTRVATQLEELPLLRAAHDADRITASHTSLLVRVATPESEARWLETAQGMTVRELQEAVRAAERDAPPAEASSDTDKVKIAFAAPARLKAKWAAALDLYRKLEGSDAIPEAAAAEAFAAEWRSGLDPAVEAAESPEPQGFAQERLERGESRAAEPETGRGWQPERHDLRAGCEVWAEKWRFLEKLTEAVALPRELELLFDPDEIPDAPAELHAQILRLDRYRDQLGAVTGRILLTMARIGMFRAMRFASLEHYARERLGLAESTARQLVRIERKLFDLPELRKAYFRGELGASKVRLLVRIATEPTEVAWIERAKTVTVRRLEREIQALELRRTLRYEGFVRSNEHEAGLPWVFDSPPPPIGVDLERYTFARPASPERYPWQPTAQDLAAEEARASISFWAEPEVAVFWTECVALCRAAAGGRATEWECAEAFIDAFLAEWDRPDPRKSVLAHKVMARDGYRCAVPGCAARSGLHAHHIVFRSQGGGDELSNLITVCSAHHLHGIHEDHVAVTGQAPDALVWELGSGSSARRVGFGEVVDAMRGAVSS